MKDEKICMLLRLGDEREFIEACIRSVAWADYIVCVYQNPKVDDPTMKIVTDTVQDLNISHKLLDYVYPYEARPNGPDHYKQPYDEYNRAYFYNHVYWKAVKHFKLDFDYDYLVKWDGDMVAMPELKENLRSAASRGKSKIYFSGRDMVAKSPKAAWHYDPERWISAEPRMFLCQLKNPWVVGRMSAAWNLAGNTYEKVSGNMFLHFKWVKDKVSATRAWPKDWQEKEHFRNIWKRGESAGKELWPGPVPEVFDAVKYHPELYNA